MNTIAITSHKEMPKFLQEINAVLTIAFREIINTIKSPEKIIPTVIMQFMFLVFMGGGISQNLGINMGFNFNEFIVVGMVINVLFMTTSQGITTLIKTGKMILHRKYLYRLFRGSQSLSAKQSGHQSQLIFHF